MGKMISYSLIFASESIHENILYSPVIVAIMCLADLYSRNYKR